jgi:chorismate dehydratase
MLLSNCPLDKIKRINLDFRSKSSVNLAKILAKNFWNKEFSWYNTEDGFDFINIPDDEANVLIGDRCFEYESRFRYRLDLAGEWFNFSGLPFAFACWTSNKKLDDEFLKEFNDALATGVNNIPAVVEKYGKTGIIKGEALRIYLTENMNFDLNDDKRKAIKLYLDLLSKL